LDKYQLVGYILTFLNDAQLPLNPVWRAILRQQVFDVQYTDNEKVVYAQRERMVVDTEYPTYGVSLGIHHLFH